MAESLYDVVVEVRNAALRRVGVIQPQDLRFSAVLLHNQPSSWSLTLPKEHPLVGALYEPGAGIVVSNESRTIISGPVVQPESVTSVAEDWVGSVTFAGVSDSIILWDALAYPNPSTADVSAQGRTHDRREGTAEFLMHSYVRANIGPNAPAARKNKWLVMGDQQSRGQTTAKAARFQSLGALLGQIAAPSNLGFRVIQRGDNALVFETYETVDHSADIRLTIENNSLASDTVTITAPSVTRAIVGGAGKREKRRIREVTTSMSLAAEELWGRRIEQWVDQPSSKKWSEFKQAGTEALVEGGRTQVSVRLVPGETLGERLGQDWWLGDTVTIEVNGVETSVPTSGAAILANEEGVRVGVAFGEQLRMRYDVARRIGGPSGAGGEDDTVGGAVRRLTMQVTDMQSGDEGAETGRLVPWATNNLPQDALWAEGGTYQIADYPELAAELGTRFGGNGTTTFGVPNMGSVSPSGIRYVIYT